MALIFEPSQSWLWGTGDLVFGGCAGMVTIPFAQDWAISRGVGFSVFKPEQFQIDKDVCNPQVMFSRFLPYIIQARHCIVGLTPQQASLNICIEFIFWWHSFFSKLAMIPINPECI